MAKVKTKQVKAKKKQWLPVYAPKSFNGTHLGDTNVTEAQQAAGKSVTVSLMTLTDDPRKQAYSVRFDVTDVKDGKAQTQVIGMSMTTSAIKRLIRRHRDKISDSFIMRIAGGRLIRVKPMIVTRTRSSKSAQTEIRLTARQQLREQWKKMRFDDIIHEVIDMKVQRLLKDICGKTHPVRTADVREVILLPESRSVTKEMQELLEKEAAEEEAKREQLKAAAAAASVEEPAPQRTTRKKTTKKASSSEE